MSRPLRLPQPDGSLLEWRPSGVEPVQPRPGGIRSRRAYAAAHVVADPLHESADGTSGVDWDTTLAFRRHLWSLGLGVAEAMDTAQRGMGLGWEWAKRLISETATEAKATGGQAVFGVATDQSGVAPSLSALTEAYIEQVEHVEGEGGQAIIMASRLLASCANGPEDYLEVYDAVIQRASRPVMIHWLGEMFDPALAGYWGSGDPWQALETVLELARRHPDDIDGIKISLLDDELERALRSGSPPGVSVFTGDDFNYPKMILGDETGHSDALLGIFDPIAPVAATALQALDDGDVDGYRRLLEPTLPLGRHLFSAPTYAYKSGVVFLAYLNGHQAHFRMIGGAEGMRSVVHLSRALMLADEAGLLTDPDRAVHRMSLVLELSGLG